MCTTYAGRRIKEKIKEIQELKEKVRELQNVLFNIDEQTEKKKIFPDYLLEILKNFQIDYYDKNDLSTLYVKITEKDKEYVNGLHYNLFYYPSENEENLMQKCKYFCTGMDVILSKLQKESSKEGDDIIVMVNNCKEAYEECVNRMSYLTKL